MKQDFHDDVMMLEPGALIERLERLTSYEDPFRFDRADQFKAMMLETLTHGVSDIFIQPALPVVVKKYGRLYAVTRRTLDVGEVNELLKMAANRDTATTDIVSGTAVNERYELFDPQRKDARGARLRYAYRVNASPIACHDDTSCQIVIRAIPDDPPRIQDVGLSEDIVRMATPRDGIVYVAGATGHGKTTTFAAINRFILENDTPIKGNLISHEEPIEFTYDKIQSKHSIFVQSQIPTHFKDFYRANREAMRRAPGLCVIGELRDQETIRAAVELSLTGHPVFGTVHAKDVAAIMRRMISRFPEQERATAIYDLVDTSRFMMAQKLVPTVDGKRTAARSWLKFTEQVRDTLMDLTDMGRVTQRVAEFVRDEGHTFAAEADRLLAAGVINEAAARDLRHG